VQGLYLLPNEELGAKTAFRGYWQAKGTSDETWIRHCPGAIEGVGILRCASVWLSEERVGSV